MKDFNQFQKDSEKINEGLLQKSAIAALGTKSKRHGDQATRHFNSAISRLKRVRHNDSDSERLGAISNSIEDLLNGLIELRQQNGAITSILVAGLIFRKIKG